MFISSLKDTKKYTLNLDTADQRLQNIFEACEQTPNMVPLQTLAVQKDMLVRPIATMTYICHIILFLLILLPFLLCHSKYNFMTFTHYDSFYVTEHYAEKNQVCVQVNSNTVDLANCYIVDSDGNQQKALSFIPETDTVIFPFSGASSSSDLYITDTKDQILHLSLTSD